MRGNFIGLASPVIDLTLDVSGYLTNDSISSGRRRRVKKETVVPGKVVEGGEGEGVKVGRESEGGRGEREGEDSTANEKEKRKGGKGVKKQSKRKSRVVPLELTKHSRRGVAAGERKEGEGDVVPRETDSSVEREGQGEPEPASSSGSSKRQRHTAKSSRVATSVVGETERRESSVEDTAAKLGETPSETAEGGREEGQGGGEGVVDDCLVSPGRPSGLALPKVKVHHKAAKKRVSISKEVLVIGGEEGRCGREGRDGEWTPAERRKLSRYAYIITVCISSRVFLTNFLYLYPRVIHSVPAITDNFWEVVSMQLATGHTAEECGNESFRMKGGKKGRRGGRGTAAGKEHKQQPPPGRDGVCV